MDENIEVETVETSYSKGFNLEKEFATFLKTDLGWEKSRTRAQMASSSNMRGTNVDVIAERLNEKGLKLGNYKGFTT